MFLAMGSRCASTTTTGAHPSTFRSQNSEFELHGRTPSPKISFGNQACTTLKLRSRENWRTWSPEDVHWAHFDHHSRFQRIQPSGFLIQSSPSHSSHDFEFPEVEKTPCLSSRHAKDVLQVFPCVGRFLLILLWGCGLSMPALAHSAAPPVSTVSEGDTLIKKDERISTQETVNVNAAQRNEGEGDGSNSFTSNLVDAPSSNLNPSEISDNQLRLSVNFWKGIPTYEGSHLHVLKVRLDRNPRDSIALEALLRAVMEQRDMLRALTVLETLLEIQPNDLKWKFLKARTHEFLGELLMAKNEYEELLNMRPLSARFLQGLAMLLNKLGEQTQALELIQQALDKARSDNKDTEARNLCVLLCQYHIQLGNFEAALQHLGTMIDEDPYDYRPYLCQGLAYTLMEEKEKATANFKKYMQLCPPDAFDQDYMDSLMVKARTEKRTDAMMKAALKGTFRNRKPTKPLKKPSLAGNFRPDQDDDPFN